MDFWLLPLVSLFFTLFINMDFPRIFQNCWAQASSKGRNSERKTKVYKGFHSIVCFPVMPFHPKKKKKQFFLYERQDMLLMDLENKLFVIVTLELFNKYSSIVVKFYCAPQYALMKCGP